MHAAPSLYPAKARNLLRRLRLTLAFFMVGLVLSGLTCFPLLRETTWILHSRMVQNSGLLDTAFGPWLGEVHRALTQQSISAPFLFYGTDWLGFAHLVLAAAFIGPWLRPVRNRWVIDFGLIACAAVPVLALVAGPIRGIPMFWRLVDCSFGVVGAAPLLLCRHYLYLLSRLRISAEQQRKQLRQRRRLCRIAQTTT